jgi:uncharacterized protein (DUF1778 family)
MPKTITLRFDDEVYKMIELAAEAEDLRISEYVVNATIAYLTEGNYVSEEEMREIVNDEDLMAALERARIDIAQGNYEIVE